MIKRVYYLIFFAVFIVFTPLCNGLAQEGGEKAKPKNWEFISLSEKVKANFFKKQRDAHVLVDPGYRIWGLTVIRWTDGKFHGYYARWPDSLGHSAWMTHCEIAHAVADSPEGPFKFKNVVLESKNVNGWDVNNAHNPNVTVANGKICLYYIANDLSGKYEEETKREYPDLQWLEDNRKLVRNSQRIGVATATDPSGPFKRASEPVVEPHGIFKNIAVNPAVTYVDGKFVMIMKGDKADKEGWHRIQIVGHSTQPEGPFIFSDDPVYAKTQTEDAGIWYDRDKKQYYMTCHVMGKPELALFTSRNGHEWQPAQNPLFMKKQIVLDDGNIWKPERVERPFILTDEQGKPIMVYVAVADKGLNGNIAIPVK